MTLSIILLAAGHGSRMLSKKQKILHEVGGKPMIMHIFEAAEATATQRPLLIVGVGSAGVKTLLGDRAAYAVQAEQLGTGHAAMMAQSALRGKTTQVVITYGDMPLLKAETLKRLADAQEASGSAITMLSVVGDPATPFGRIVRDEDGRVTEIVEVAEARHRPNTAELLAIRELNVGVYCFDADWLWENINDLPLRQARSGNEYYLTDMAVTAVKQNRLVEAIVADDPDEALGAGTRAELAVVEKAFRRRANGRWLAQGVTLIDPDHVYIDQDVVIGQDSVIWPGVYLQGRTVIGADCVIGPNAVLRDAIVADGATVEPFTVIKSQIGN